MLCKSDAAASSDRNPHHDRPALLWDLTNNITYGCWKSDGTDANDGYVESTTAFGFEFEVCLYVRKFSHIFPPTISDYQLFSDMWHIDVYCRLFMVNLELGMH